MDACGRPAVWCCCRSRGRRSSCCWGRRSRAVVERRRRRKRGREFRNIAGVLQKLERQGLLPVRRALPLQGRPQVTTRAASNQVLTAPSPSIKRMTRSIPLCSHSAHVPPRSLTGCACSAHHPASAQAYRASFTLRNAASRAGKPARGGSITTC